jgi:hypothetical protein
MRLQGEYNRGNISLVVGIQGGMDLLGASGQVVRNHEALPGFIPCKNASLKSELADELCWVG